MILLILSSQLAGCASFGMGQGRCDAPVIPTKPEVKALLARPGSTAMYRGEVIDLENFVCYSPDDSKQKERWIRDVLRACGN
jgi:hypothetical protein